MNNDSHQLTELLGEQIRCAEAMLEVLGRESEALTAGDQAALGAATDAKARLVDTLEALESQRRMLGPLDDDPNDETPQRLRDVISRCKEQNLRNGTLLKARAESVRIALKVLRGSEPELYSADGRTPGRADARTLGTA